MKGNVRKKKTRREKKNKDNTKRYVYTPEPSSVAAASSCFCLVCYAYKHDISKYPWLLQVRAKNGYLHAQKMTSCHVLIFRNLPSGVSDIGCAGLTNNRVKPREKQKLWSKSTSCSSAESMLQPRPDSMTVQVTHLVGNTSV